MPRLIDHIDAIARQKQRGVLYLMFHAADSKGIDVWNQEGYDWREDPMRENICQWLTEQGIAWKLCGHFVSENMMMSYRGQIYIDVPFDEHDAQYQLLREYLEHEDGSMRYPTVTFCYLTLKLAMKNAHHDEPGFWEKWAETF